MIEGPRAPDFLAIVGPTGAGKTAVSIGVAREIGGEIVSVDSRQIYRGMDVGTAKATARERAAAPHHGLDIRDPGERYSAGEFGRDARRWIAAIEERGRVPMLVGGTGFFLKVLTEPIFRQPPLDRSRRRAVEDILGRMPGRELERWVRRLDPVRADIAVAGGCQRMLRALSIVVLTGRPLSWWHRRRPREGKPMHGVVCLLEVPMDVLDSRIRKRVRAMVAQGLVEEVAGLLRGGCSRGDPGLDGVGYREIADHLAGEIGLEEAVERTRVATRQYARRQRTWFRHQLGPDTVRIDGTEPVEAQCAAVAAAWRARAGPPGRRGGGRGSRVAGGAG